jgi:AmmeMemoRadiSam system protein B
MNKPIVAGQFYEADFAKLNKQIEGCFHDERGPGDLPTQRGDKVVKGVLVPHGGYVYSGACAAWAYKEIAEAKMPKRFVILAPDHNGLHAFPTTSKDDWEMPFGPLKADKNFIDKLLEKIDMKEGEIKEHAVEVQLPFLQFACKDNLKDLRIVPIIIPTWDDYDKLAEAIAEISDDICVIISSDFTHYGHGYGHTPFKYNVVESITSQDDKAIDFINKLDAKGFHAYKKRTKATICGAFPIMVGVEVLKAIGVEKGRVLSYYMSGDLSGDYDHTVSYASILFK